MVQRAFSGAADLRAMAALVRGFPMDNLHVADLPYRFSSWAFDYPNNVGLWVDAEGRLSAWAVMQTPFWTIDYACHPDADRSLHRQILAWADGRARRVLDTPSGRPSWFVNVFADQVERIRDLEEAGFASQADVGDDSWSKVLMQRSAEVPVVDYDLPEGFVIRPLKGESEVEAYVELHCAVFESRNMTTEWRSRTLRQPAHTPDLDLVAVSPDGRLAAFCVGWPSENPGGETTGQVEPLGVHANFREMGLGRAILIEGLRRLQLSGASRIYVETDNYRNAAFELYESAGFRVVRDVLVYRKDHPIEQQTEDDGGDR
jgi:ribosomal protein S18 acetylase RimI-like enzyme